jgi:putative addiction module component (TIGR02574 family)
MEGLGVGCNLRPRSAKLKFMNARVDHLLDEVLGLPAEERSAVAAALIDSLEGSADSSISEAWKGELLRRREALRSGSATSLPWTDVRARMSAL